MIAKRRTKAHPYTSNSFSTVPDVMRALGIVLMVIAVVAISIKVGFWIADYYTSDHSVYQQP
jgi:hypothetical protein